MKTGIEKRSIIKTKWAMIVFYILIVFEFLYMASPFAIYFYSVYTPGLNFLNQIPGLSWMTSFFMPHIINQTSSVIINLHNIIGAVFVLFGLILFIIGAFQVYYYKISKKGAVTGGLYKFIRHPQYTSFAICSFGILLLWPRYLVLIMFISVLFLYYFLAKLEERECEEKFGESYSDYKTKANMFLPFRINIFNKPTGFPQSKLMKTLSVGLFFVVSITTSLLIARWLHSVSLNNLFAVYKDNAAYVSVTEIEDNLLHQLISITRKNENIQNIIDNFREDKSVKFINYVLPAEMYVSEIPMKPNGDHNWSHFLNNTLQKGIYKIVFTKAVMRTDNDIKGEDILLYTYLTIPIIEVWIDQDKEKIVKIFNLPNERRYGDAPVPIY